MGTSDQFRNWAVGAPVTVGHITQSPVWMDLDKAAPHIMGPGMRVVGRQLLCNCETTNAQNFIFSTVAGGATIITGNFIAISPDTLNGRIALIARNFSRYVFRHVRIVFVTRSATSSVGAFAISMVPDPEADAFVTISYPAVIQTTPSCAGPVWSTFAIESDCLIDNLLWTEVDAATTAGGRQTMQYGLLGALDINASAATLLGEFFIEYVCDFYVPSVDFGFSLPRIRSQEELLFLKEQQRRFRDGDTSSRGSWVHEPLTVTSSSDGRTKPR
jgi:hypothetical protein